MAFTDPPLVAGAPTAGKGLALTLRGLLPFNKYGSGPATAGQALLADGAGRAAFGNLPSTGTHGVATVNWPGGSLFSTPLTVTHGLGATPSIVLVTLKDANSIGSGVAAVSAGSYTGTTFVLEAATIDGSSPTSSGSATIAWEAK